MTSFEKFLFSLTDTPTIIIDECYKPAEFIELDLSVKNPELSAFNIAEPKQCQEYINTQLNKYKAQIGYGGYLEERNLYKSSPNFNKNGDGERNIHLGIDIWAPAGTEVLTPLDGVVHSYKDNSAAGDYGPTLILKHSSQGFVFYTLYGHLSQKSLAILTQSKKFKKGDSVATLGNSSENGNYAPHLHFQLILDPGDFLGDYPGVCSRSTLNYFRSNCPDPNLLLKIPARNIA